MHKSLLFSRMAKHFFQISNLISIIFFFFNLISIFDSFQFALQTFKFGQNITHGNLPALFKICCRAIAFFLQVNEIGFRSPWRRRLLLVRAKFAWTSRKPEHLFESFWIRHKILRRRFRIVPSPPQVVFVEQIISFHGRIALQLPLYPALHLLSKRIWEVLGQENRVDYQNDNDDSPVQNTTCT